jgi:hypothetical protein
MNELPTASPKPNDPIITNPPINIYTIPQAPIMILFNKETGLSVIIATGTKGICYYTF